MHEGANEPSQDSTLFGGDRVKSALRTSAKGSKDTGTIEAASLNLPVEIWQYIFGLTADSSLYPASVNDEVQVHLSNRQFLSVRSRSPNDPEWVSVIHHRFTFIRVCKFWYHMVIPILWAHLRIDYTKPHKTMLDLYNTLKTNPHLAEHVIRLTVSPPERRQLRPNCLQNINLLSYIMRYLPRLRILSCGYGVLRTMDASIQPEIVILRTTTSIMGCIDNISTSGSKFWQECRTLSISCQFSSIKFPTPSSDAFQPNKFPNLLHLATSVVATDTIRWITSSWTLPSLRTLSVLSHKPMLWVKLIYRLRHTLEQLEVLMKVDPFLEQDCDTTYVHEFRTVEMAKLKTLCIRVQPRQAKEDSAQWWIKHIQAPILESITLRLNYIVEWPQKSQHTRQMVEAAMLRYPTVRRIGLVVYRKETIFSEEGLPEGAVDMADILAWCKRDMTVEIVAEGEGITKVYSKHSHLADNSV